MLEKFSPRYVLLAMGLAMGALEQVAVMVVGGVSFAIGSCYGDYGCLGSSPSCGAASFQRTREGQSDGYFKEPAEKERNTDMSKTTISPEDVISVDNNSKPKYGL